MYMFKYNEVLYKQRVSPTFFLIRKVNFVKILSGRSLKAVSVHPS